MAKYHIRTMIDCVAKAILGELGHEDTLIFFLNSILIPYGSTPITSVQIQNPFNLKDFKDDRPSAVDILATDVEGRKLHVEAQISSSKAQRARALYYWARLFSQQLRAGQIYDDLNQVISIWLFEENVIPQRESSRYHHRFRFYDTENKIEMVPKGGEIHLIELAKWHKVYQEKGKIEKDEEIWFWLFSESEEELDVDHPPEFMQKDPMKNALETIRRFGEDESARMLYNLRLDHQRLERQKEKEHREELTKQTAIAEKEKQRAEQEKAERLKAEQKAENEKTERLKAEQKAEKEAQRAEEEKEEKLRALKRIKELEQLLNR